MSEPLNWKVAEVRWNSGRIWARLECKGGPSREGYLGVGEFAALLHVGPARFDGELLPTASPTTEKGGGRG